jgi:hypothetical protein
MVNAAYFRFEVRHAIAADEPTLTTIAPGHDTASAGLGLLPSRSNRKLLALVVVAVEQSGGQLCVAGQPRSLEATVGLVVVAPSYCSISVAGGIGVVEVVGFHAYGDAFR